MRIIRGKFKSRHYPVPKGFPSRPTTDFAKEGLFNLLENRIELSGLNALDLCAGTGSLSMELLSRGAGTVLAVDSNPICVRHIAKMSEAFGCKNELRIIRSDVLKFSASCTQGFDLILADPPYEFKAYDELIELVVSRSMLNENGLFVLEHGRDQDFSKHPRFSFMRKFGNVHFSFFE